MASITLVVGRDPRRLLERAASGFLTPRDAAVDDPFPSPDYVLALRQGGVRDDLIALAAERGVPGWFNPPLCIFHELPDWLGATDRTPCADFTRAALLSHVVRESASEIFGRLRGMDGILEALEQLVGELCAEGVSPDAFAAAIHTLVPHDEFERARNHELEVVYRGYHDALESAGLRDGRDALVDCARAIERDPDALGARLGHRREIRFFGLQDPRGGWRVLLRALAATEVLDRVVVYSSDRLSLGDVPHATEEQTEAPTMATRLFTTTERGPEHMVTIEAPTVERELAEVGSRIRTLVDRGVALDRIAVVARRARPYVDLVLRTLRRFAVPATARRRYAYRDIPVIRSLLALYRAAASGWTRARLAELADLPYLEHRLDSRVLNYIGYRRRVQGLDEWRKALDELLQESQDYEAMREGAKDPREQPPPSSERVRLAIHGFVDFLPLGKRLEESRSLGSWLDALVVLVREDPLHIEERIYDVPPDRLDVAKRDLTGWRGLEQILAEWLEAVRTWGGAEEQLTVARFHSRLQEMLAGDVALWTETLQGVRVLEGLAAAYRSFDHVFLVGMAAGQFPLSPPRSAILDEADRASLAAAGLPLDLHADWEARERSLFRVLVAGTGERLTLSSPRLGSSGSESIRSAFVDALADVTTEVPAIVGRQSLVSDALPLFRDPAVATHAARMALIERQRELRIATPYTGYLGHPELVAWLQGKFGDQRLWSPTQLEAYAKCPWAYFSGRLLGVEKLEDPDDEMEPTVRGSVLHDALARFYGRAVERNGDQPVFLRQTDLEWAEEALVRALDVTLDAFRQTTWLGTPVLRAAKREELRRILVGYLQWEVQLHEDMFNRRKQIAPRMLRTAVALHERHFDHAVLDRDGVRFVYRGAVDRVEVGIDERVKDGRRFLAAVDYKTTKASTPGGGDREAWDEHVALQLPLYAHALEQLVEGAVVARVEYRALVHPERVHTLELHAVDKRSEVRYPNEQHRQRMDRALGAVPALVKRIRGGEFPAAPAPSCGCPSYCHAWDICRVSGGPKLKETRR